MLRFLTRCSTSARSLASPWSPTLSLRSRTLCYTTDTEDDEDANGRRTFEGILSQYFLPAAAQKVILIQPRRHQRRKLTLAKSSELMEEARALVDSLETWTIVEEHQATLRGISKSVLFSVGVFKDLSEKVCRRKDASAVFINTPILTGLQLATLQRIWGKFVYDRYTLVLQIFRLHARTSEAKLQIALAEVPYLRSRMSEMHVGHLDGFEDGLMARTLAKNHSLKEKMEFLDQYKHKLLLKLKDLEEKRDFLRRQRRARDVPVITIVGYTNAGKTSLIKRLTSKDSIEPCDKLFATLDVSNHSALLPNNLKVVLVDTIGFFSDIPTSLIAAFKATLKDCMDTDLLIHVVDISHTQVDAQTKKVNEILDGLSLPAELKDSMIVVGNKSDRAKGSSQADFLDRNPNALLISCITEAGLSPLKARIEDVLEKNLGFVRRRIRAKIGGNVYEWLHREATVESFEACPEDNGKAILTVLFSPTSLLRFQGTFQKKSN